MTGFKELTKEQLAERIGVSVRQVDYLVARGQLPAGNRKGKRLKWLEAVAETWKRREYAEQLAWVQSVESTGAAG